jgi:hypothetical protein
MMKDIHGDMKSIDFSNLYFHLTHFISLISYRIPL